MKKINKMLVILLLISSAMQAQNSRMLADGNEEFNKKIKDSGLNNTGRIITDANNNIYNIYKSKSNKLFILIINKKNGKQYKKYLKEKL